MRRGLHNLLQNLNEPVVAMNDGLQGRPGAGGRTLVRFVINSTLGLAGLFDQARKAGLPHHDNGFGLTLGRYGVPDGPRFRLPLLGPFTVREAVGEVVDFVTDPVGLVPFHGAQRVNIARTALELIYDPEDVETQDQGATPPPAVDASASELPPY